MFHFFQKKDDTVCVNITTLQGKVYYLGVLYNYKNLESDNSGYCMYGNVAFFVLWVMLGILRVAKQI